MAQRVSRFEAAVAAQTKAQELESTKVGLVYDLFRKTTIPNYSGIASPMTCTPKILGRT
jgi:hypothetical protein